MVLKRGSNGSRARIAMVLAGSQRGDITPGMIKALDFQFPALEVFEGAARMEGEKLGTTRLHYALG